MKIINNTLLAIVLIFLGWFGHMYFIKYSQKENSIVSIVRPKPLEKYTIENLSKTQFKPSRININENIFDFLVDGKKVTGLVNIPETNDQSPIIILLRGYVDQTIYTTGTGTKRVGEYFKDNGYITLAPDFLGYGESDPQSENIFESRFQTYTTTLTLLASINKENFPMWDGENIFIWAHSNGGQIALTTLAVLGESNPDLIGATVLWAPVTEAFPYTVLFYTNESDDGGKYIRQKLAKFEEDYDVNKFSFTNYLDRIHTPIQYHWGTKDDAISSEWRDKFLNKMKKLEKDVTNFNHVGADHNMNPLWNEAIEESLTFFEHYKTPALSN